MYALSKKIRAELSGPQGKNNIPFLILFVGSLSLHGLVVAGRHSSPVGRHDEYYLMG
jgi:hypothetical protein